MLKALKIWRLNRRLEHLTSELALARKDHQYQRDMMELELAAMQHKKQDIILRLIDLQSGSSQEIDTQAATTWPR